MKIFITKQIPQVGIDMLLSEGHELTINPDENTPLSQEDLINNCKQHDALIVAGFALLNERFFSECSHLKVISLLSVGYDTVDLQTASKYKIPISNTPDVLSKATAEIAFLLMLSVARKSFYNYMKIVRGEWKQFQPTADLGIDLHNATIGIYGLGKIGFEMAKKCKDAYGMKVIYHNRNRNEKAEQELYAAYVSFDELLHQSDVLSVHANLSESTKGIFDKDAFSKMKTNAIFVNTARGTMHNEEDLKHALDNGIIWGAGLDVTNPEPMQKDNPLLFMPNVCVLPHIGSATQQTRDAMATLVAKNIIAADKGEPLPTLVNKDIYNFE